MQRRSWLVSALALVSTWPALAQDNPANKELIAQALQRLRPLLGNPRLVGEHRLTYWGFDLYHASLWASSAEFAPADWSTQRLALELRYLRDFQGRDIAQRSIAEMHGQRPLSAEQSASWLLSLQSWMPNVRSGDVLTGVYLPDSGAQFLHQGKAVGEIREVEFARRFFGIWLSPQTSQPQLRQQLLAGAS